jgi:hypothetical protein
MNYLKSRLSFFLKKGFLAVGRWHMPIILATWEVKIGRISSRLAWAKKFARAYLNGKKWAWWHVPVILIVAGSVK